MMHHDASPMAAQDLTARVWLAETRLTHHLDPASLDVRQLLAEAERLGRVDAATASQLKARIHALTGDRQQLDYWFANARRLRHDWRLDFNHVKCLLQLGFFSEAAVWMDRIQPDNAGELASCAELAVRAMNLRAAEKAYAAMDAAGLRARKRLREFSETSLHVMTETGLGDATVLRILDVAGEVLREHQLGWQADTPVLHAYLDQDDAFMLYELSVPMSTTAAVELTTLAMERLIDRDLDGERFSISFLSSTARVEAGQIALGTAFRQVA